MNERVLDGRVFASPGPGAWELEMFHVSRPVSPLVEELFLEDFTPGFREGLASYGALLSHFEFASVHRFIYMQPAVVGAPRGAKGPPPTALVWLMTRAHPALRERLSVGAAAFEKKLWRDDMRRWDEHEKPSLDRAFARLADRDPSALNDAELAALLRDLRAELKRAFRVRHRYTASSSAPVGDFVAHVTEWTGLATSAVLDALRGHSPVSRGLEADALRELVQALREDEGAAAALQSEAPARDVFDALAARSDALGARFRAWFAPVSRRCMGVDVTDPAYAETPETLRQSLVASLTHTEPRDDRNNRNDREERLARLRERVPPAHRAHFDALQAEATFMYRLRDERGTYTDGRIVGLLRRAMLEAGARLAAKKTLDDAILAAEAHPDELARLLTGARAVSRDELAERRRWRTKYTVADAPPTLGGPPAAPPPIELLPPHARRSARAFDVYTRGIFSAPVAQGAAKTLYGLAASTGTYEGRARVLSGPEQLSRIERGDVLVVSIATAHFNAALPLVGAIVTERGGQLSHAAVVAREFAIPAVVATGTATRTIPDGARVRVDGDRGLVTLLT